MTCAKPHNSMGLNKGIEVFSIVLNKYKFIYASLKREEYHMIILKVKIMAPQEQNEQRLIIISNRLPLSVKSKDGTYEAIPSSGGLVTALKGLSFHSYLWLGWPGVDINERDRESVGKALAKENASAVYLDENLAQSHYNGFSSAWPIFLVILLHR